MYIYFYLKEPDQNLMETAGSSKQPVTIPTLLLISKSLKGY